MVFNATFNNISVISWGKQEYPEKTTFCCKSLTNSVVSGTPRHEHGPSSHQW